MSKQEFEPQEHQSEAERDAPHYPYTWSGARPREGMPRDEPYLNDRAQASHRRNQFQVPWWARPQRQPPNGFGLIGVVLLLIVLTFFFGGLGLVGVIIGSLAHILSLLLIAFLALLLFLFLLIVLIFSFIGRALRRLSGPPPVDARRGARRSWHIRL